MMRQDPRSWLLGELSGLVERGILDAQAAQALRERYSPEIARRPTRRLLTLTFGVLGSGLVGSGLLLVLAHNWDELTRPARAALALGLLVVAQALACWAGLRRAGSPAWTEGAAAFLALATLTSISLVAQTYHLGGDLEQHLLASVALTIPPVYLLRSRVAGALVWIGATGWFMAGPWPAAPLSRGPLYLALLAATLPFLARLWRHRRFATRTVLWNAVIGGSLLVALIRPASLPGAALAMPLYAGLVACLLGFDRLIGDSGAAVAAWRRPLTALGLLGTGIVLWIGSFGDSWPVHRALAGTGADGRSMTTAIGLALLLFAAAAVAAFRSACAGRRAETLMMLTPLLAGAGWLASLREGFARTTMLGFNAFAVVVGLLVCVESVRAERPGRANAGLLLVTAVLAARFFDTDFSFLARGLAFVLLGAGFLGFNLAIARRRGEAAA